MAALDYYRILGVKPDSTLEEVRRRYRVLARQAPRRGRFVGRHKAREALAVKVQAPRHRH